MWSDNEPLGPVALGGPVGLEQEMNEYLVINSTEYLCTNPVCLLVAAWLDASQTS